MGADPSVLESAWLQVRPGQEAAFEAAFRQAQTILSAMPGYRGHELQRSLEAPSCYLLLVRWDRLEDHTEGFRRSPGYCAGRLCCTLSTIRFPPSTTTGRWTACRVDAAVQPTFAQVPCPSPP